ncbi:MAG: ribose-5-phosphate isomerase RpiA [Ignavibacteria bacterium]|nr:ribose-5-phosphate isomerase RpiA [Ignavibacteria bacterium]
MRLTMTKNELKKLAAQKSLDEIKSGMVIGLGSGSTFKYALEIIAEKIKNGELKDIKGVPSSIETEKKAKELGIPVITLNQLSSIQHQASGIIDVTIDGADEACPDPDLSGEGSSGEGSKSFHLIKGGGGALLREKILFQNSKRTVVIIDDSKLSDALGSKSLLPVEVIPFAIESEKKYLESLGAKVSLRLDEDGGDFITDEGNLILDADFGGIKNLVELNNQLNNRAGIVEHGLFLNAASVIYCASNDGVRIYKS